MLMCLTPAPVWKIKTPASETADVWLPLVKEHLALFGDASRDSELTAFTATALSAIEAYAQIAVFETTFTAFQAAFAETMTFVKRPFVAVPEIRYAAPVTGTHTIVPSNLYHAVETGQRCGTVFLGDGNVWPETAKRANAVQIDVTAGFASADEVPPEIVHALLMTVAALDANRGDCGCGGGAQSVYAMKNAKGAQVLPDAAKALLAPWRYISFGAV